MVVRFFIFSLLAITACTANAQQFTDNAYRNNNNALYWQLRRPDAAYWQQDVAYNIQARLHEDSNYLSGTETLAYWNNSPDTLHFVYFHLYQNAFIKGSYLHQLEQINHAPNKMGKYEAAGKGIVLDSIMEGGKVAATQLDNTVMKVYLHTPLAP
ncbi:MAG: M1 family peptidase, partial [Chitinophagia bacterium]|nr:M1 family peptidase [Chitinophagia bacterium]